MLLQGDGWGNDANHMHFECVVHLLYPLLRGTDVAVDAPGVR